MTDGRRDIKRDRKSEKVKLKRERAQVKATNARAAAAEKSARRRQRELDAAKLKAERAAQKKERDAVVAKRRAERQAEADKIREAKRRAAELRLKKRLAVYAVIKSKLKNNRAGFDYKNFGFVPRVELAVSGDATAVSSRLAAAGIAVYDMRSVNGETLIKIRKKELRKAVAILDEMCYTHRINATYGIVRRCTFLAARFGLALGLILSVVGVNIAYGYVWRVDISGNENLSKAAIEAALKHAGVSVGCKKSEPLAERVAGALDGMTGIADASCEVIGTTLYVRVLESKDFVVNRTFGEYRAAFDATVTRISVGNGTALAERGDVVKRGQTLVTGDVFSTAGELLYSGECNAEVYGNVSLTFSAEISSTAVEYRRTGRSSVRTSVQLFGMRLGASAPPYKSYEMTSRKTNYDVLLPLYFTSYTYYETAPVEYERDIDEVAEEYALSVIEDMKFVGDFDYSLNVTESKAGLHTVHLFLSGEALISEGVARTAPVPETNKTARG